MDVASDACVPYLNQVLAFWLGDEWLQFRGCERVDEASLGDDQQKDLGTGEDREFVGLRAVRWLVDVVEKGRPQVTDLLHDACLSLGESDVSS
jgi:hypothetical protein